jgi:hypothetical protein
MVGLVALNLISAGKDVINNVVDACSSSSSSSVSDTKNAKFDNVLKSEVSKSGNPYAGKDATELAASNLDLQKKLADSPEVKAFIGNDKSFKVRADGDGYLIERSDGTKWHVPSDSKTEDLARSLCQCRSAQAQAAGSVATGMNTGWTVNLAEAA